MAMAAPVLQPIRTGNMTSTASNSEETRSKTYEKVKFRNKETPDPLRVLEPVSKKLTLLEAQRIMAVVEDSIRRLEISTILPYIVENLSRFSILLGLELTNVLHEHDKLQSNYQKSVAQLQLEKKRLQTLEERQAKQRERFDFFFQEDERTSLGTRSASPVESVSEGEINLAKVKIENELKIVKSLQGQLEQSLKTVLRLFARNPTALDSFRNEKNERSHEANGLITELNALRGILFERLLRTPLELKERDGYVAHITEKERKSSLHAKKLQQELAAAIEIKENEVSKNNDSIRKLRFDIFNTQNSSREHNQQVVNEATKEQTAELKNSEGKKAKLNQEIIELKKYLESNIEKHRLSEQELRKKKYKVETEVENWIQKFDIDMGERQDEFDQLDVVYTEEKKQLNELEERFRTMEKEYLEITEERRIAREKAEQANRELQAKIKAATLIQSFWRAVRARKQLLKSKKKKGKKGKKGGKKKIR